MSSAIRHRLVHWIACCAILFNALAPAVSHALAPGDAASWMQICSLGGARWVSPTAPSGAPSGDPASDVASDHAPCPYCATHAASFGLPPSEAAAFMPLAGHDACPAAPLAQVPRAQAVLHAHSRAPPSFL